VFPPNLRGKVNRVSLTTLGRDVKPWVALSKKSVFWLQWMPYDTLAVELKKNQGLHPDGDRDLSETHLRTTEIAGSPFSKIVSTTA